MRPSLINGNGHLTKSNIAIGSAIWSSIKSEEDHGFVVSFGIDEEMMGFLPKKQVKNVPIFIGMPGLLQI